jgi:hypothetical protein
MDGVQLFLILFLDTFAVYERYTSGKWSGLAKSCVVCSHSVLWIEVVLNTLRRQLS